MNYNFDVALSFAGEDRDFAEAVAHNLRDAGVKVFYDNFYAHELWGEDLSAKLREVYNGASQYCLMVLSDSYVQKMWTIFERQQAVERLIRDKGSAYVLPVRLDGFSGEVSGLSGTIGYLNVGKSEPERVVETFLRKIGKAKSTRMVSEPQSVALSAQVPKLKRSYTDKEKNQFRKEAFAEICSALEAFCQETQREHKFFEFERENITSRSTVFTLYQSEKQVAQFKIWIGGMMGSDSIAFRYGTQINVSDNGSMNESISTEEYEGELKLKPLGIGMLGARRDTHMTSREVAEYLWEIVCRLLS